MSNLLDKSSLVLTPTAYNNGKILSVKPEPSLGNEKIVNGTFDENVNGWVTNNANASFVWQINKTALFTSASFAYVRASPALNLNAAVYKVSFDILSFEGTLSNVHIGLGTTGNVITTTGSYTYFYTSTGGSTEFQIRPNSGGTGSITIDNVSVKQEIDGDFNFTRNSSATRVNSQGLIEDITSNLPRIDYTGGVGHWLFEPQSTNLFLNSETLSTQGVSTNAASYTVSFYGTGSITFSGTHTGTLNGTGVSDRVSLTFTASSGTLTSTVSGSVTKAQSEASSFATSYIPTNGSTVTRLQDAAFGAGSSDLINSTEGVLYAEIAALANGNINRVISISDETNDNLIYLRFDNSVNRVRGFARGGGGAYSILTINGVIQTDNNKIALVWDASNFRMWVNGVERGITAINSIPSGMNTVKFTNPTGGENFFGKTKCVAVFKEALTDAELTCLTTI